MKRSKKIEQSKELDRIIHSELITTVFQAIVSLKKGTVLGYEALSRGPEKSILYSPDNLFNAAARFNRIWDLELLCRKKAIKKAFKIDDSKLLFINVSPIVMNDSKFIKGFTKTFLLKHNISPESIIFEVTEKTSIKNYKNFREILSNYIDQGYKIAIDDAGSGYSGIVTIAETRPNYVKLDMDLIRNIDKDNFKQSIVKTFVDLSENTNIKLVAEGIETEAELNTLIKLGVYAGQGFFLQRPSETLSEIPKAVIDKIIHFNKNLNSYNEFKSHHIGQIVIKEPAFNSKTLCVKLKDYFIKTSATGACVVNEENLPIGLVMEHTLDSKLAMQYGNAVFSKRSISLVMDDEPLVVDYYTAIDEVSKYAMERNSGKTYDYVIVIKESKYYGIVTIKKLLEYTTILERNYAKELNPLTGLPGNTIIDRVLKDTIFYGRKFCILYFDLNNFKIYNDTYGFENGDKIIKFTANSIQNHINSSIPYNSFVGHVGGDDFVCVVESSYENCIDMCKKFIEIFDKEILNFFNEKDRSNGYLIACDRKGDFDTFGLTSIAIAGIYGNFNDFSSSSEISKYMAVIKKEVKKQKQSACLIKNLVSSDSHNNFYKVE